ncbi:type II secretion system protein [Prosthecobacter sp. SYSU 5D2]|uniref:type II secretion system protein n=1 Tax=Prosthecobacter sp. SYSU 5D2 TaxID=3134134 RepID=UPI0031FE9E19
MKFRSSHSRNIGFTLVEAIFTIAIIGIMASLAISAISNGARDSFRIVARQQQAAVQEALNAWVMSQSRVTVNGVETAQVQSLESIRNTYNSLKVTSARFDKIKQAGFLDPATIEHFDVYSKDQGTDRLKTAALEGSRQYLSMPDWQPNAEPRVELIDE